ncbi:LOW QUALITY PROTEIN: receptor-transporting protein 5 [Rhynchonycteris naso]
MDGVDVWASTLAQLMVKRKPEDTWELVPKENQASGHLESSGSQYWLRGVLRRSGGLQCSWPSAHVHRLVQLWWDKETLLGLVKVRIWAQVCQLCLPDIGDYQVSLLNMQLFLDKLVLFTLQKWLQESFSSDQCPRVCFRGHYKACNLGVCFFQKPPDPTWGLGQSPSTTQAMPTLGSGPVVNHAWDSAWPSVSEALFKRKHFFHEDPDIITVLFTLVHGGKDKGCVCLRVPPSEADPRGLLIIDRGCTHQPPSLRASPASMGALVNIKAPILHDKGHQLSSIKSFQVKGFIFKGCGSIFSQDKGLGSEPSGSGRPAGDAALPVSHILVLTEKGEGSITFPASLAIIVKHSSLHSGSSSSCERNRRRARRSQSFREEDFLGEEDSWCWLSFQP